MKRELAILISSAGRRNKLISCFREAAKRLGVQMRVLATDMNPGMSAACHDADAAFAVPHCLSGDFDAALKTLCLEHQVRLVIPTIDTELPYFSQHLEKYRELGVLINVSLPGVVRLARDKMAFHHFLSENRLSTPRTGETTLGGEQLAGLPWPCIFKPRDGSRSIGIVRAQHAGEVPPSVLDNGKYIWQECWQGREYTINFFVDKEGRCPCVIPYERLEVRDGEISKGITRRHAVLEAEVRRMAEKLSGAYGAHCTQAIMREDGSFVLFELNARFGGGYPLADNAGAHFAQWLLEDALGLPSSANNDWAEKRVMLRYDDACFCSMA